MGKCELLYEGKVREVYDCDDKLVMVATDRISAFDHILKNKVTEKGAILTQMSKFWFDYTKDVVACLLYTSPSPRDAHESRMPSSA